MIEGSDGIVMSSTTNGRVQPVHIHSSRYPLYNAQTNPSTATRDAEASERATAIGNAYHAAHRFAAAVPGQ